MRILFTFGAATFLFVSAVGMARQLPVFLEAQNTSTDPQVNTITGSVALTTPLNARKVVTLYSCSGNQCGVVDQNVLDFSTNDALKEYSFTLDSTQSFQGYYKVVLHENTDTSTNYVYIFFNPRQPGYRVSVSECGPSGLVKKVQNDEYCELSRGGKVNFTVCTDATCYDQGLFGDSGAAGGSNPEFGDSIPEFQGECSFQAGTTRCPLNTGVCSVCNLERYFVDSPEKSARQKAIEASQICQGESGGNPFAINRGCMVGGAREYSVGLFQINLLWAGRCPQAARAPLCSENDSLLIACMNYYFQSSNNIQKMLEMSGNGIAWRPWTVARNCKLL